MIKQKKYIYRLALEIIDLIFPKYCIGCGQEGEILCQQCRNKVKWADQLRCDLCGKIIYSRRLCSQCRKSTGMCDFVSIGPMENLLREALHKFKYEDLKQVSPALGEMIAGNITDRQMMPGILVPMPLHYTRLRERGYNQSALIARSLNKYLNWPVVDALVRVKKTHQQMKLHREARLENVKGAFLCRYDLGKCDMPVYLVDDVMTTGATMKEAAKVLKKAGADKIVGVAAAVER